MATPVLHEYCSKERSIEMVNFYRIGPAGGQVGQVFFDDIENCIPLRTPITKILINAGEVVDSIEVYYGDTAMPRHGGNGGAPYTVVFDPGDYLIQISGIYGQYFGAVQIGQLTLKSHKGKIYGPFGAANVTAKAFFSFPAQQNEALIAFFGSTFTHSDGSTFLSSLGVYAEEIYARKLGEVGGATSQIPFDDMENGIPPQAPLSQILINAGDVIDSIQVFYGETALPRHGGSGGELNTVNIAANDYITEVSGFYGQYFGATQIGQITIRTHLGITYGPFGDAAVTDKTAFSLITNSNEEIVAFYGSTFIHSDGSDFLCSLGAYTGSVYTQIAGPAGGQPGQIPFDDLLTGIPSQTPITKIVVNAKDVIDAIQVFYGDIALPKHGDNEGSPSIINLVCGDYITEISGVYGDYFGAIQISKLTLKTHLGKVYGPFGTAAFVTNPIPFTLKTTTDTQQFIAFFGSTFLHTDGTNFLCSIGGYIL
jgi:hypothetical protein